MELISLLVTILVTTGVIGLIVFVHELGHFLAARSVGVRVEKFSIGFGPKLFKKEIAGTEFSVRLIMLGGFVQMYGDLDASSTRQDEETRHDPESYLSKNPLQKLWITVAGVLMNFFFAAFIFIFYLAGVSNIIPIQKIGDYQFWGANQTEGVYTLNQSFRGEDAITGLIMSIEGQRIDSPEVLVDILSIPENYDRELEVELFDGNNISVERVILNGEGYRSNFDLDVFPGEDRNAGEILGRLQLGSIDSDGGLYGGVYIDGEGEEIAVSETAEDLSNRLIVRANEQELYTTEQLLNFVDQNLGSTITFDLLSFAGEESQIVLDLPAEKPEEGGVLGISFGLNTMGYNAAGMVVEYDNPVTGGFAHAVNSIGYNAYALGILMSEAFQGRPDQLAENVGSIVAVGDQVGQIISFSSVLGPQILVQLLNLIGVFSAILAFMNILPIPILDGGNVVFIILEALRGKPLPKRFMDAIYLVFFVLLILLSVVVIGLDIFKIIR